MEKAESLKKAKRSIKIYPIFASFTGDMIFFVPIDTLFLTLVKELTVKLNKARQAAITTELVEINAGVEAMK